MKPKTGTFLGFPYDWTRPSWAKLKTRTWNPGSRQLWSPHAYGWGYTLNVHELLRRLRIVGRR